MDLYNFTVKVSGPSPLLSGASPEGKFIRLNWQPYVTDIILGYNIYRKEGDATGFIPDSCTSGIPDYLGFEKIAFVEGVLSDNFIDNNSGHTRIKFELADCLTLLLDVAAHEFIDVDELLAASEEKMEINKKRKWGEPDENGVVEHIPE